MRRGKKWDLNAFDVEGVNEMLREMGRMKDNKIPEKIKDFAEKGNQFFTFFAINKE